MGRRKEDPIRELVPEVREFTELEWLRSPYMRDMVAHQIWKEVVGKTYAREGVQKLMFYASTKTSVCVIWQLHPWRVWLFPTRKQAELVYTYMRQGLD